MADQNTDNVDTPLVKFKRFTKYVRNSASMIPIDKHRSEIADAVEKHVEDIITHHEDLVNRYLAQEQQRLLKYTTCTTCFLKTAITLTGDKREPVCRECVNKRDKSPGWSYYRGKLSTD